MYRPTMPFQSISVACLAAGPIFVATLAVAHIYEMTPKPIPVSVSAGALVAFVPAAILVSGFGFILSLIPNLVGSAAMMMAGARYEVFRMRLMWAIAGGALPLPAAIIGGLPPELTLALCATGTACAAICRRGAEY